MNLSISTAIDFHIDVKNILPLIRKSGFEYVEIWSGSEKLGKANHFDFESEEQIEEVNRLLNDLGLKISSLHSIFADNIDISHPKVEIRDCAVYLAIKSCDVLKKLGGEILVLHPASVPFVDEYSRKEEEKIRYNYAVKNISEVCKYAMNLKLKVAMENQLPHIFGSTPETLLRLIRDINLENLGICFDSSHASFFVNTTMTSIFVSLANLILTTHISDTDYKSDEHLIPGYGRIDWKIFEDILKSTNYKGVLNFEVLKIPTDMSLEDALIKIYNFGNRICQT